MFIIKKAIVTGANGFLGSHLVRELVNNNIKVFSVVRNKKSNIGLVPNSKKNKIIYCDLSKIENITKYIPDRDIDVFYHLAWEGSSGQFRNDENLQINNALWTINCVKIAKKVGCKKFIGAGSIMEKEVLSAAYKSNDKLNLGYIYGASKVTAHCISKSVATNIQIDLIWTFITNTYGPGERSPRFINKTLRKIINKENLNFSSGTQIYDFIYITDVAKAFYYIGLQGKSFKNYTIGSGKCRPLKNFILEIQEEIAPELKFNIGVLHSYESMLSTEDFSTSDLINDTDFRPSISFKQGILNTMSWLKESLG